MKQAVSKINRIQDKKSLYKAVIFENTLYSLFFRPCFLEVINYEWKLDIYKINLSTFYLFYYWIKKIKNKNQVLNITEYKQIKLERS